MHCLLGCFAFSRKHLVWSTRGERDTLRGNEAQSKWKIVFLLVTIPVDVRVGTWLMSTEPDMYQ